MRAVWLNRIVMVLALVGMVIAGTLTYAKFADIVVPCGLGTGCDRVSSDPSSMWFGLPVALYGLLAYVAILGIAVFRAFKGVENTHRIGVLGYWITLVGAMVSLGLQIYSGTVIKAWCDWCLASAATMLVLFLVQAVLVQSLAGSKRAEAAPEAASGRRRVDFVLFGAAAALSIVGFVVSKNMTDAAGKSPTFVVSEADAPSLLPVDVHSKGPTDAPITIVEFGDLCCPACQKAFAQLTDLQQQYEGKIRIVFRHFPLVHVHPQSFRAAVYAEYAASKGLFWEYLNRVYQVPLDQINERSTFENILLELNMNVGEAEALYENTDAPEYERVYRDLQMSDRLGLQVTPTFFVVVEGERPYSIAMSDLAKKLERDEKFQKLLGTAGG